MNRKTMMSKNPLNVYVYKDDIEIIEKSGIGKSTANQINIHNLMAENAPGISVNKKSLHNSDVVHINSVFPRDVRLALNARLHGIKVIYHGHSTKEDFMNSFRGSCIYAPFFKIWIMFCYSLGDVIVTPTEYSKKILKRYGIKRPITAISNGIDTDYWKRSITIHTDARNAFFHKYGIPSDKKVIMSVGHYMERKGFSEFCSLARKNPGIAFIWFGYTTPDIRSESIKRTFENIPENMHLPGFIAGDDLKKAYEYCDLFLFMSHEETEGIVVLEAMAMETPMIVRDIPAYNGWLKNNINTYMFRTRKELQKLIPYVLSHDNRKITANARKSACMKDFKHIGEKYRKLYEKMNLLQ